MNLFCIVAMLAAMLQRTPQIQTGVIEGTVTRTDSVTPISGVLIEVEETFPSTNFKKPFTAETKTDGAGHFTIREVPPGNFSVSASLEGYWGRVVGAPLERANVTVSLLAGQQLQVRGLILTASSKIEGRVTDSSDAPVADQSVQIVQRDTDDQGRSIWRSFGNSAVTNSAGEFVASEVPPGNYYLRTYITTREAGMTRETAVYFPGTSKDNALPVPVREGEVFSANIRIPAAIQTSGFTISGRVVHSFPRTSSDAAGFRLFDPPVKVALREQSLTGLDLDGTVVAEADEGTGLFEIRNVGPGNYDLFANVVAGDESYMSKYSVSVYDHDVEGVALNVLPGVDVQAQLVIDGEPAEILFADPRRNDGAGKHSAANIRVALARKDFPYRVNSIVDEVGTRIALPNVPEGEYDVSVNIQPGRPPLSPDIYVADVRIPGRSVYDSGIRVGVDPADSLQIVIGTQGGSIEGTIPKKAQTPAVLILMPESLRRNNPALYRRERIDPSDPTGAFRLRGIAPGDYKIFAVPDTGETLPFRSPEFGARYDSRAVSVIVRKGATVGGVQVPLLPLDR